ncbi:autophagy-related protein 13-domain-containing protein [Umbelopsis sp. AD052]|nr:autophagy-related protein 13-domain-containing protein [Umbelopsis sp. AD052]
MMQSQHPPAVGTTPPRNSKLDHIIQNFYTKAAQVIVQARLGQIEERQASRGQSTRRSSRGLQTRDSNTSKKANKWFNLVTEDLDVLKEDLKFWRTQAINPSGEEPPPMKIDIFLDVSELSQNQILVVVDETLRRNRIDLASSATSSGSRTTVDKILLESWTLTLNHPIPDFSVDLPNLYKRSIVFFRSLHSYVRLLPAYNLYRRLRKYGNISQLRLGYRMVSVDTEQSGEIGIDVSIVEHDARSPTKAYEFADIMTPLGHFNLKVEYRRNCDFQVDDMERDLSARFIDMDEHYFTPTMAKYQQEQDMQRTRSASSYEAGIAKAKSTVTGFKPGSLPSPIATSSHEDQEIYDNPSSKALADDYSDPREIVQQRQRQASMTSMSSISPVNRERLSFTRTGGAEASTASIGRKPSATNISPFKSPSLSSSPIHQSGSEYGISQSKYYSSPTGHPSGSSRPFSYQSTSGDDGISSSARKVEFSSSFDRYKGSPSRGDIGTGMSRRLSRNSDHSLVDFYSSGQDSDSALEEFMQFVQSKQELKMFSSRGSATATPENESSFDDSIDNSMMASGLGSGSMYKSKRALSRFQALRESHDNLSESMSASMMGLGITEGRSYGSPSYTGVSPTSSSSSQSRYHQPAVPSPLHATQRVGPIHIPRDMSAPTIASHLHRRQLSHESQTNVRSSPPQTTTSTHVLSSPERAAYSSYPSDPHHKDLKRLPPRTPRSPPDHAQPPRSRDILSPRSSTMDRPSKSVTLERLATSASPPRSIPRHISNRHASSGGSSPIIGPRPDLQPTSYSSLNEDANESSQRNRPENSGHALASGTRSGSLLDDDDSLVFKMSELDNETGTFDSGVYNNPYQGSLYSGNGGGGGKDSPRQRLLVGPNSHFASTSGSPKMSGGEDMSRRLSSGSGAAMATVMEQEEPNTASSNSSSSSAHERRAGGPDAHMFSGDW